ncbi:hypothetical protein M426DRAFT_264225 [Hypoxylon sp. CI-4A]|nr:hypothetical protein M426DRAFT_264225 [Hypoxylon sp. CI-4A]
MASITSSSTTSSSPVPSDDPDDLTLDLQPAPLRLPPRKIDANFDGSSSMNLDQLSTEDEGSTSTINRGSHISLPQPSTTNARSQRRVPAPKLGSLVSKFETLGAATNDEPSSILGTKPSAISLPHIPLRRQDKSVDSSQHVSPVSQRDASRYSPDVSPRQSPAPFARSKPQESASLKNIAREDGLEVSHNISSSTLDKKTDRFLDDLDLKVFEHESAYSPFVDSARTSLERPGTQKPVLSSTNSLAKSLPVSNNSKQNSPTKSKLMATTSASPLRTSQRATTDSDEQTHHQDEKLQGKKPEPHTLSRRSSTKQQPSVADLRKSFELNSPPSNSTPQTQNRSVLPPKTASDYTRSRREMPHSSGLSHQGSTSSARTTMQKDNTAIPGTLNIGRGSAYKGLKSRASERSLSTRRIIDTAQHTPTASLPKNSRFRQRGARTFDGAVSLEHVDIGYRGGKSSDFDQTDIFNTPTIQRNRSSYSSLIHQFLTPNSKSGTRNVPTGEQASAGKASRPRETEQTPRSTSKFESVVRCTGKVSDLRKLFERTAPRDSSPNSPKLFWKSRSRNKVATEREEVPSAGCGLDGSSIALAEQVTPLRRIPVPELTTEISTNDFSCDFTETLGETRTTELSAHFNDESDEDMPTKQVSPVKDRIQQFERLESQPSATSLTPYGQAGSYDGVRDASFHEENNAREIKARASWHPFRQRSVKLWRRISNGFSRPAVRRDGTNDDSEQAGPSNYTEVDGTRPCSPHNRVRYRRSDFFGYHMSHTSEVVRSSSTSAHSESSVNIDDELIARLDSQPPYLTYTRSHPHRIPMRKTFPFLSRMSDSLESTDGFGDFGFDGSVISKAIRRRAKSPTAQDPEPSSSSVSRGNSNTLSRVMSQQTVAERKRRRLEEKQTRREQKEKKREEKTKGKGKDIDTGDEHRENGEDAQGKGKGKEVEGKKKESSWSKKTASGFVVRQINDIKLKHPKPRRPGQVKRIVNMYKEKSTSGIRLGKGSGVSSKPGAGASTAGGATNH